MALKEKDLVTEWIPQLRWSNGNNVSLASIREAIQDEADKNGIPVAFGEEQIKVGGLFSSEKEDILLMYNPEHAKDYLRFALRVQHQGRYAFLHVFNLGGSKNFQHENYANNGNRMRAIANAVGGHKQKLQAEENYYTILRDVLSNVTGADL